MEAILVAATPTIVAALLASLGVWLKRRSRRSRADAARTEARERIAVIKAWLDAHQALAPSAENSEARHRALADLESTYDMLATTEERAKHDSEALRIMPLLKAALLLNSTPPSIPARLVLIVYYVSLGWFVLWVAAAVLFGVGVAAMDDPASALAEQLAFAFGITVLSLAIGLAPALLLYLIYRAMPRHPSPSGSAGGTPGDAVR
ncbi:MAG TPA: hypothetical protein VFB74_14965 [Kribbellaceae bacterium]|nr:hypothetical protein [Kribbellaceae bacterium]